MSKYLRIQTRYPGRVSARGHEETPEQQAAAAAHAAQEAALAKIGAQLQLVDARGQAVGLGGLAGRYQILPIGDDGRGHAVSSAGTIIDQQLTNFAVGYPGDSVIELINYLAPYVPALPYFDYVSNALANAFPSVDGDAVGADGLPPVIVPDANTHTAGKLIPRGVRIPFTSYDKKLAGMHGNGVAAERQARVQFGLNAIQRGSAARVLAAMETSHGAAHAETITVASEDPIKTLRPYITAIADVVGSLDYVRVLIGGTSWNSLADCAVLVGGSGGTGRQDVTVARLARGWNLRESNVRITNHQVVSSVQGKTTTTRTTLVGGNQMWIYGCKDNPDREDPSFIKRFAMNQGAGYYQVSVQDLGGDNEMIWIEYFERVVVTNSTAADRLALTFS